MLNPTSTGSHYQRYIFKGEQLFWRPRKLAGHANIVNMDIGDETRWSGSADVYYEILSGSNVRLASTSGSVGDGYAYGDGGGAGGGDGGGDGRGDGYGAVAGAGAGAGAGYGGVWSW